MPLPSPRANHSQQPYHGLQTLHQSHKLRHWAVSSVACSAAASHWPRSPCMPWQARRRVVKMRARCVPSSVSVFTTEEQGSTRHSRLHTPQEGPNRAARDRSPVARRCMDCTYNGGVTPLPHTRVKCAGCWSPRCRGSHGHSSAAAACPGSTACQQCRTGRTHDACHTPSHTPAQVHAPPPPARPSLPAPHCSSSALTP